MDFLIHPNTMRKSAEYVCGSEQDLANNIELSKLVEIILVEIFNLAKPHQFLLLLRIVTLM
jgi:hypothetical protein